MRWSRGVPGITGVLMSVNGKAAAVVYGKMQQCCSVGAVYGV